MNTLHVKKGDTVQVISGKCKGSRGKVVATAPSEGKVMIEGVNMVSKHQKPSAGNPQGGIINKEAYLDVSNVMFLFKGQPTRIGFKVDGDTKVRIAKKTGEAVD